MFLPRHFSHINVVLFHVYLPSLPDAGFTTADLAPFPSAASAKSRTVAAGNAEGNNIEISNPYIRISDCFTGGKHPVSVLPPA